MLGNRQLFFVDTVDKHDCKNNRQYCVKLGFSVRDLYMRSDDFFAVYMLGVLLIQRIVRRLYYRRIYNRRFDFVSFGNMRDKFYLIFIYDDIFYSRVRRIYEFLVVSVQERRQFQKQLVVQEYFCLFVETSVVFNINNINDNSPDDYDSRRLFDFGIKKKRSCK